MVYDDFRMESQKEIKHEEKKRLGRGVYAGILLLVLGVIFLLNNFGITSIDIGKFWPVFLILSGLYLVFGFRKGK